MLVLAGAVYANPVVDELVREHDVALERVHRPLARLQVGERLRVLKLGIARPPRELDDRFLARSAEEVSIE